MSIRNRDGYVNLEPAKQPTDRVSVLQSRVDECENVINRIRWNISEMDGVLAPSHLNYFIHVDASRVVSDWLDEIDKKKKEDAEKAKIVQIVNEELDKRTPAKKRNNDLRA